MADVRLIVTDAAPLIVLSAADALDLLRLPGLPIAIPDAVFYEATHAADKLGALQIVRWVRDHADDVRIEPTDLFQQALGTAVELAARLPRDLGERAALEVVRAAPEFEADESLAILLTDDRDAERLFAGSGQIVLLTTSSFLLQLERAHRIQSADHVLDLAREAGLNPSRRDPWIEHDPEVRAAVEAALSDVQKKRP